MTKVLALVALFFAGAYASVAADAVVNPDSNCVAGSTVVQFQSMVSSSFNSNTLTYTRFWSLNGGADVALPQPSCPASTGAVTNLICVFPNTVLPASFSYVDLTETTVIYKNPNNNAKAGDTYRYWTIPTVGLTKQDATCAGNDGSITITATGLAGHFENWTYSVNGGAAVTFTTSPVSVTGLVPGDYSVTINNVDGSACHATSAKVTVGSPYIPTASAVPSNPSCPGVDDGSIIVSVPNSASAPGGTGFRYSINSGVTWFSANTFANLAGGQTYHVRVGVVGGCNSTDLSVTLTAPVAPAWTVTYDCGAEKLGFGGVTGSLVSYSINGGAWIPIATSSGHLADSETPYTIRVNYTTGSHYCVDSKPVTVSCVHHCALSHGYWKNQGVWFTNACQHFATAQWCGWNYIDLLTATPSSIDAASRAKFIAGRQYVTFVLTMYYYTPSVKVDVRSYTVQQLGARRPDIGCPGCLCPRRESRRLHSDLNAVL